MIFAKNGHIDRHFRIEVLHLVGTRLEQLELQTPAQAGLVDLRQQGIHFSTIGQLLEQGAELTVDFIKLTTILVKVHGQPLLRRPVGTQLLLLAPHAFELGNLVAPVEPPESRHSRSQQPDEYRDARCNRPLPRIVRIQPLKVCCKLLEIDALSLAGALTEFHGRISSGDSALGGVIVMLSRNSLTRRLFSEADLTSIRPGEAR